MEIPVKSSAVFFRPAAVTPLTATQRLLLPLGAVLFDWLFWLEGAGVNMLLFTIFVLGAQALGLPRAAAARRARVVWLLGGCSLLAGGLVAVYGSGAALLASWVSLALLLGFVNQPELRLVLFAGFTGLAALLRGAGRVLGGLRAPGAAGPGLRMARYYGRLLGLPLATLLVFHGLFVAANPRYAALAGRVLEEIGRGLDQLLAAISVPHLLFFLLGLTVAAGAVAHVAVHTWADYENGLGEFVRRQRDRVASLGVRRPDFRPRRFGPLALRREWQAALTLCALLNGLLLVVNLIDVRWLWFGFEPAPGFDLTQFVHEGTWVLIFSILLAMGIVLWFFRRNLNFYAPGLPWLRRLATAWVLQNAVLAVSVGLRNYYYIYHCGLAYKRIGVCFFLLLVLFGLGTVLLKVWQRRSTFSLVRLNAWAAYAVLLALAAGNWEVWMAEYNLQPRLRTVDVGFLLDMPGRVLPTLLARRAALNQATTLVDERQQEYGPARLISAEQAQQRLQQRAADWTSWQRTERHHWQSWNYADWAALDELKSESNAQKSASRQTQAQLQEAARQ